MKRVIAVFLALIITLAAGITAFSEELHPVKEQKRSIRNVFVADEFRTSDIVEYTEPEGDKLLTLDLISDTHIGSGDAAGIVSTSIRTIDAEKDSIDGVIVSGDLTHRGYDSEFDEVYSILGNYSGDNLITANGNHDYGRWSDSGMMRPYAIRHRNDYLGIDTQKDYYSTEINGYKFIIMGNEGNKPNSADISDEQLVFVNSELKEGTEGGRPVFVICHWPLRNTHGERISWPIIPGGALNSSTTKKLTAILEQYKNVFYISGHLHAGLSGKFIRRFFKACCVEQHNGITCINVPSLGSGNHLGLTSKGTGMRLTVYGDKAIVEGRNFYTGEWLDNYVYEVSLNNAKPASQGGGLPAILPDAPVLPGDDRDQAA
ncbi:MAG: metallophosphoesterase [Clostridia bacterium]|nr:metallophosphoesterase [Clostridia bacterium]